VSFTKKILESVNEFMEKMLADGTPLSDLDEEELGRELKARRDLQQKHPPKAPEDNPVAAMAGAGEAARAKRRTLQEKRAARARAEAKQHADAKKRAQDEEFRRVVEEAKRQGVGGGSAGGSGGGQSRRGAPPGSFGKRKDIEKHYAALNLPYGASFDEVKSAYRKLMRRYHPDLHNQSPKKQKAANELTVQVTEAYNALESYLEGGPNKTK
jgi:hypothetical protein